MQGISNLLKTFFGEADNVITTMYGNEKKNYSE